ncbi:MAG: TonB family protein [Nitrospirae bacterium]|nr:TonB family protein [Nitrospirota bacterium]
MAFQTSVQSSLWFEQDDQSWLRAGFTRTLVLSLALHVVVLFVVTGFRLPQQGERPLASVEVSLVSLPAPVTPAEPVKPVEPAKVLEPKPVVSAKASVSKPAPAPAVKEMTARTPVATPPKGEVKRDVFRDLQLPPDAPKFGDLSPAKSAAQPQPAKMKSLDIPPIPDVAQAPAVKVPPRTSVSEDLHREFEEELKKIKPFQPTAKLETPSDVRSREASVKSAAQPVSALKTPELTLKIAGAAGANPYWARVQAIISSKWEPPPVDMVGQTYRVIVKFRLQRDGTIKNVVVQESSGNDYFDMAGQRAVLGARVLPAFPADMADSYKDIEMVFRVGESVG